MQAALVQQDHVVRVDSLVPEDAQEPLVLQACWVTLGRPALKALLVRLASRVKSVLSVSREILVQWDQQGRLDLRVQLEDREHEAVLGLTVNRDSEERRVLPVPRAPRATSVTREMTARLVLQGQEEVQG